MIVDLCSFGVDDPFGNEVNTSMTKWFLAVEYFTEFDTRTQPRQTNMGLKVQRLVSLTLMFIGFCKLVTLVIFVYFFEYAGD